MVESEYVLTYMQSLCDTYMYDPSFRIAAYVYMMGSNNKVMQRSMTPFAGVVEGIVLLMIGQGDHDNYIIVYIPIVLWVSYCT